MTTTVENVITVKQAETICKLLKNTDNTLSSIAKQTNTNTQIVYDVYKGNIWTLVSYKYQPFPLRDVDSTHIPTITSATSDVATRMYEYIRDNIVVMAKAIDNSFNIYNKGRSTYGILQQLLEDKLVVHTSHGGSHYYHLPKYNINNVILVKIHHGIAKQRKIKILSLLQKHNLQRVNVLAKALGVKTGHIRTMVNSLISSELVRKTGSPIEIFITDKGRKEYRNMVYYASFNPEDYESYIHLDLEKGAPKDFVVPTDIISKEEWDRYEIFRNKEPRRIPGETRWVEDEVPHHVPVSKKSKTPTPTTKDKPVAEEQDRTPATEKEMTPGVNIAPFLREERIKPPTPSVSSQTLHQLLHHSMADDIRYLIHKGCCDSGIAYILELDSRTTIELIKANVDYVEKEYEPRLYLDVKYHQWVDNKSRYGKSTSEEPIPVVESEPITSETWHSLRQYGMDRYEISTTGKVRDIYTKDILPQTFNNGEYEVQLTLKVADLLILEKVTHN